MSGRYDLHMQVQEVKPLLCLRVRDSGGVSGRPVLYSTPLCGRVGVKLNMGQVQAPHYHISNNNVL